MRCCPWFIWGAYSLRWMMMMISRTPTSKLRYFLLFSVVFNFLNYFHDFFSWRFPRTTQSAMERRDNDKVHCFHAYIYSFVTITALSRWCSSRNFFMDRYMIRIRQRTKVVLLLLLMWKDKSSPKGKKYAYILLSLAKNVWNWSSHFLLSGDRK
jgi:hypothetical protein